MPDLDPILSAFLLPLRDLLLRYQTATTVATALAGGVQGLLDQHQPPEARDLTPGVRAPEGASPPPARPPLARIEVGPAGPDALLAFAGQLAELPGVTQVVVAGSDKEKTTFLVQLAPLQTSESLEGGAAEGEDEGPPTVVCVQCGRVMVRGGSSVSHGLCPDCFRQLQQEAQRPGE